MKGKKLLGLLLCGVLSIGLFPAQVFAQSGTPALTVNQNKVAFAGHEWWVIGDENGGIYSQKDYITLLAATSDGGFQDIPFREGGAESFENSTAAYDGYYANNPSGMAAWKYPNEYAGSTQQQAMEMIAAGFSAKEQALISPRNFVGGAENSHLPGTDGISGQKIENQKLWALSEAEVNQVNNDTVLSYNTMWWLRTPDSTYSAKRVQQTGKLIVTSMVKTDTEDIRPALSMNISSVFFTSAASETSGKSLANVEGNLINVEAAAGTVKFTMQDSSQYLTVNDLKEKYSVAAGDTLDFTYSNATRGNNQYVSCVLRDIEGNVVYYGKLADSSEAESGTVSVPFTNVAAGTYTLEIFSEEVNDTLYTDFCSAPAAATVSVHEHNWNDWIGNGKDMHTHTCSICDRKETQNCSGGMATCKALAVCETCGQTYGSVNPDNHTGKAVWVQTTTTHSSAYDCCGTVVITEEAHEWEGGECSECGYICQHSGGEATCTEPATCEICNEKYGSLGAHKLSLTEKVEATCTTDGKEAYYTCETCGKNFVDEAGNMEITNLDGYGIIPAAGHKAGTEWKSDGTNHWNECVGCGEKMNEGAHDFEWITDKEATATEAGSRHEQCKICGYEKAAVEIPATGTTTDPTKPNKPDDTGKPAGTTKPDGKMDSTSPQTGDNSNIALWIAVMLAAGAALTGTAIYSRKRKYNR